MKNNLPLSLPLSLPLGALMIDIEGTFLTDLDKKRLSDARVGGIILFSRNFESPKQLTQLTAEIHCLRHPRLLITIDHEGGRVQRCRQGFTRLPSMQGLGNLWAKNSAEAQNAAEKIGFVLAADLRLCGVDFSYTPVLDLDWQKCAAIGDRAFSTDPKIVVALAEKLIQGLARAGMQSCGKHFPGHGFVSADSHHETPVDTRSLEELADDLYPFQTLNNKLAALMPAHIIFPAVDKAQTACFSALWHAFIREKMGFKGIVFSDDLSMQGAKMAGNVTNRVKAAQEAGCDMLLVCNSGNAVDEVLQNWHPPENLGLSKRIEALLPATKINENVKNTEDYQEGVRYCAMLTQTDV